MSWDSWIKRNRVCFESYDELLDFLVEEFGIDQKSRKQEIVDRKHFISIWFSENKNKFKKYHNNSLFANKIGLKDHSSVTYLTSYRVPSYVYNESIEPIAEELKKHYICK